jgi:hypothetical protein
MSEKRVLGQEFWLGAREIGQHAAGEACRFPGRGRENPSQEPSGDRGDSAERMMRLLTKAAKHGLSKPLNTGQMEA